MDIEQFSSILKDLILDNDRVALPGLGVMEAYVCPSVFSDRGFTIQPPYRQIAFSESDGDEDTLFVDALAALRGISTEDAGELLRPFLATVKESLERRETVEIEGLGRLRATLEGAIFFVCDEEPDIFPEGLGLAAVSLKNNSRPAREIPVRAQSTAREATPAVPAKPAGQKAPETIKEPEVPVAAPEPAVPEVPVAAPVEAPKQELQVQPSEAEAPAAPKAPVADARIPEKKKLPLLLKVFLWMAAAAAALLAFLAIAGRVAPSLVDPLLYSPEELEIICK